MQRIKRNAVRCNKCNDEIESTFRHDFVTCSCGNVSVDGGFDYIKRSFKGSRDSFTELCEYYED